VLSGPWPCRLRSAERTNRAAKGPSDRAVSAPGGAPEGVPPSATGLVEISPQIETVREPRLPVSRVRVPTGLVLRSSGDVSCPAAEQSISRRGVPARRGRDHPAACVGALPPPHRLYSARCSYVRR